MKIILPNRLKPGDTLALIAPASAPADPKAIDRALTAVEAMGFKTRLGRHARNRLGFLAGSDRDRADDLMRAFTDKRIHGILCIRGGYGSGRLVNRLDYAAIRRNPKVFAGYSDITSLHCALLVKCGLLTFHSPMAASDFSEKHYPRFSRESLLRLVTEPKAYGSIRHGCKKGTIKVLRPGGAAGELIGGNATLLGAAIGTPYQPPFRGRILFFEDVDEKPYQLDRLLTHLLNAGLLQQVVGVAVGICSNCIDPKAKNAGEYRQTIDDVLRDRLMPLKVPVVTGLPFGHVPWNATLPVGGRALLDADAGDLILTSPAVR